MKFNEKSSLANLAICDRYLLLSALMLLSYELLSPELDIVGVVLLLSIFFGVCYKISLKKTDFQSECKKLQLF